MKRLKRTRVVWLLSLTLALATVALIAMPSGVGAGGTLVADYHFQNDLRSALAGAPDLVNVTNPPGGEKTYPTEPVDGVQRTVLAFPLGSGLGLNTATLSPRNAYSIVLLCRVSTLSGYRKLVDFKDGMDDPGLYVQNGGLVFYPHPGGRAGAITGDAYVQIVLTRDVAHTVVGYLNGQQQFTFVDNGSEAVIGANTVLRFFLDDRGRSEQSAGAVARLRLYDDALTASEVAALDRLP